MSQELTDFGIPDYFEAEALGQPGNRRFRLIAKKGAQTASLWVERADVELLSQAFNQVLVEVGESDTLRVEGETAGPPPQPRGDFPRNPDIELRVGRWAVGYDQANALIIYIATSIESALETTESDEIIPEFRVALPRDTAERFADAAEALVAAGRPRCPLCGTALSYPDEPHACVKQNGHHKAELVIEGDE
ncbi:MAG: DUF3090 family protein [Ktedonobacterales bacterium]|nr:DUF3090 family protein [Ktedonobacterales bacterium]